MARDKPTVEGLGFPPGLSLIQEQLQRLRDEGFKLASRLRDEASGALADGQRAVGSLVDQVTQLGDDFQQRVQSAGREVEQQIERLLSRVEAETSRRTDAVLVHFSQTLRREQDRLRDRLRTAEARLAELTTPEGYDAIEELRSGATWARTALEQLMATVRQTSDKIEEVQDRIQQLERRFAEAAKETARDLIDGDDFRHKLGRLEQWVSDIAREAGGKRGEQSALRERLARLETRFVNATKEDAAKATAGATMKERQARIEARVGDLTKELLARSIDLSTIRERLSNLEALIAEIKRPGEPAFPDVAANNR
jgi:chromosome segregation ATPase